MPDKAIITCSITGVLTDPAQHHVPVTPEQLAAEARRAYDAGASVVHVHFRQQTPGKGHLPSWDPAVAKACVDAMRAACPDLIINQTTGVVGPNYQGPLDCLRATKPEMAACNAGSLNYLKTRSNGTWAWPPMLFDNQPAKVKDFLDVMAETGTLPEFECFDVGIVRCVEMYVQTGMYVASRHAPNAGVRTALDARGGVADLADTSSIGGGQRLATNADDGTAIRHLERDATPGLPTYNFVMGVESGMPADADLLPILLKLKIKDAPWQTTLIGRSEIWPVHRRTAELGGHLRSGLEDTFYLPDGGKVTSNAPLIEQLATYAREAGRAVASPAEARQMLGLQPH